MSPQAGACYLHAMYPYHAAAILDLKRGWTGINNAHAIFWMHNLFWVQCLCPSSSRFKSKWRLRDKGLWLGVNFFPHRFSMSLKNSLVGFPDFRGECKMTQTCYSQAWAPVCHRIPTMQSKSSSLNCFLLDFSTRRFKQESLLKGWKSKTKMSPWQTWQLKLTI